MTRTEIVTYNNIVSSGIFHNLGALGSSLFYYWNSGRLIAKTDHWANANKAEKSLPTQINEVTNDDLRRELATIEETETHEKEEAKRENALRNRRKRIFQAVYKIWNTTAAKKRFTAITLAFPKQLNNEQRLKVFNTILTRWRSVLFPGEPFVYMWVRETHKSGLFHYHLITTNYIDFNRAYEIASETVKNECGTAMVRRGLYFDDLLKKKDKNAAHGVAVYISKLASYVSKSEAAGRCFGCSRVVSAMFSSVVQESRFNDERRGDLFSLQASDNYTVDFYVRKDKFTRLNALVSLNDAVKRLFKSCPYCDELDEIPYHLLPLEDMFNGSPGKYLPPEIS
jgi:hypothetical protein